MLIFVRFAELRFSSTLLQKCFPKGFRLSHIVNVNKSCYNKHLKHIAYVFSLHCTVFQEHVELDFSVLIYDLLLFIFFFEIKVILLLLLSKVFDE